MRRVGIPVIYDEPALISAWRESAQHHDGSEHERLMRLADQLQAIIHQRPDKAWESRTRNLRPDVVCKHGWRTCKRCFP